MGNKLVRSFKTIGGYLLVAACFAALIVLNNIIEPVSFMSRLWEGYWGGMYIAASQAEVPCIVRFYKSGDSIRMVLQDRNPLPASFEVKRNSEDEEFLHLQMTQVGGEAQIQAKQLYLGQRYILGRLMAGRFHDFWKRNEDDDIIGTITTYSPKASQGRFEIERLGEVDLLRFYNQEIATGSPVSTVREIESRLSSVVF